MFLPSVAIDIVQQPEKVAFWLIGADSHRRLTLEKCQKQKRS